MSSNDTVQLVECGRCRSGVLQSDMGQDPRWGEVCDMCHTELLREYGSYERTVTER